MGGVEDFKALPVSWKEGLADILRFVEEDWRWPEGLLDALIFRDSSGGWRCHAVEPEALVFLLVVYRLWASVRMGHLEEWFRSWVPDSFYSAGKWAQFGWGLVYHCGRCRGGCVRRRRW